MPRIKGEGDKKLLPRPRDVQDDGLGVIDFRKAYTPHEGQKLVHASDEAAKILMVGRRWGKSRCAFGELLDTYGKALSIPVPDSMIPPFHAWIVVPNYPQGRQTWNELVALIPQQLIPSGGLHRDEWLIYLRGSEGRPWGQIEIKSAHDPEALQTVGLDFLWVNEAQDVSNEAFEKLLPTIRSPQRMRRWLAEGIPPTYPDHWFYRVYQMGVRQRTGYFGFTATSFQNPMLTDQDRAEIEQDRELVRDSVWRRMYLAEFAEGTNFFNNVESCGNSDLLPGPIPGRRYVAGLDLGRKRDASVIDIADAEGRRVVYHQAWDAGQAWVVQMASILQLIEEWEVENIVVDATGMGGDYFAQELATEGAPVTEYIFTPESRQRLIDDLAVSMERHTISYPHIQSLIRQLWAFQPRKQTNGKWRVEAPPGEHDDEVFALALCLQACDPPAFGAAGTRLGSRRYAPTQADTGSPSGKYARIMQDRRSERTRRRLEAAGIEV